MHFFGHRTAPREIEKSLERLPPKGLAWEETVDTVFSEGMESVPYRYAIDRRNTWMLNRAALVVMYVTRTKFKEKAHKQGKTVIEISEYITGV